MVDNSWCYVFRLIYVIESLSVKGCSFLGVLIAKSYLSISFLSSSCVIYLSKQFNAVNENLFCRWILSKTIDSL